MKTTLVLLTAVSVLAACGGSETGANADFDALVASASNTFDRVDAIFVEEGRTPFVAVANDGGFARYNGAVIVSENELVRGGDGIVFGAVGTLTATADFSDASVMATANNFYEIENVEAIGNDVSDTDFTELTTLGSIDGSFEFNFDILSDSDGFAGVFGTVTGDLTKMDDSTLVLTGARAEGGFVGDNLDGLLVIGGGVTGDTFTTVGGLGLRE